MASRRTVWLRARPVLSQFQLEPPSPYAEPLTPPPTTTSNSASYFPKSIGAPPSQFHVPNEQSGHQTLLRDGMSIAEKVLKSAEENSGLPHHNSHNADWSATQTQAQGSPIDALLAGAASLASSPSYALPPRHAPHDRTPRASPWLANGHIHHHAAPQPNGHGFDERPSKRARSEFLPSPQQSSGHTRPATSHVPTMGWSYNVEQMADNGSKMHQGHRRAASYHHQHDVQERRISQAEADAAEVLLLFYQQSARPAAKPEPATAPTGEWTTSNPAVASSSSQQEVVAEHTMPLSDVPQEYIAQPLAEPDMQRLIEHHRTAEESTPAHSSHKQSAIPALQTHTPPEETRYGETANGVKMDTQEQLEPKKGKAHQGWPKGRPRGPRARAQHAKRVSKSGSKAAGSVSTSVSNDGTDQLQSPQSLPADVTSSLIEQQSLFGRGSVDNYLRDAKQELLSRKRRNSITQIVPSGPDVHVGDVPRPASVPPEIAMAVKPHLAATDPSSLVRTKPQRHAAQVTICAGCNSTPGTSTADADQWISCNGCKAWFHFACAGFTTEREVRSVAKFFCADCKPKHGPTTFVRQSSRAHTAVDYGGLNEGVLRTSDDIPEHHYIQRIKDDTLEYLLPETFPRMRPELVNVENFERSGGFLEPVVIPACWNPRPKAPDKADEVPQETEQPFDYVEDNFDYEYVLDDGQDKLDMVIPQGLTVRRVAELYGPEERVEVIDVKSQGSSDKRWNMRKWADYYEQEGEKPVRNVISLEVSRSKLGKLIKRPKVVRDLDLQDAVWPETEVAKGNEAPKVQFYCLMSVADCYTDFHIDFGGSSVYYHIIKGKKTFFFIPPKKHHLKRYEEWCLSADQNHTWLPLWTKECYRVDLSEGDTMLIPSGWIHAVWTPENSLVIGGNFVTRMHYSMQISIMEIEKNTKVARKFRYPFLQKIFWYTVLQYLERDPLPTAVAQNFYLGNDFPRPVATYHQFDKFGHNSDPGRENFHARYYSKAELDGLPDLLGYIFRTVMISLGKVEGITVETKNAVTRSIPKGKGDPLEIAKTFAMWVAWKRGNEKIPEWAHPNSVLPTTSEAAGEKKLSAAALKKLEKKAFMDAVRIAPDRQSARQRSKASEAPGMNGSQSADGSPPPNYVANGDSMYLSTPKTSVLGPKRIACDACRRRRIRCKHKEDVTSSPDGANGQLSERRNSLVAVIIQKKPSLLSSGSSMSYTQDGVDVPSAQQVLAADRQIPIAGMFSSDLPDTPDGKRGRHKACLDCRKSKVTTVPQEFSQMTLTLAQRRCIHDEYGNIDPVKASETPVPRGTVSSKKRRTTGDADGEQTVKKVKKASVNEESIFSGFTAPLRNDYLQPNGGPAMGPSFQPNMIMPSSGLVAEPHHLVTGPVPDSSHDQMTEEITVATPYPVDIPPALDAPVPNGDSHMPSDPVTDQPIPLDPALTFGPEIGEDVQMEDVPDSLQTVRPPQEPEMVDAVLVHDIIKGEEDQHLHDVPPADDARPVDDDPPANNIPPAEDIRLRDSAPPADDALPPDDTVPADDAAPAPSSPIPQPQPTAQNDELPHQPHP
ncbi:JmjC domain-containing histone demethylation protein 1 [Coniosporium tulheliwenetii]|uniref:JmjC domain-containing histone demethylation protein 1 n=1 Tax=Coniosporium tulheliwenetii TaxID=3383036 RepID=A0ACC2ZMQ3_9PEZI|nr:JmjC domain-containing histone demethylation protein 1 [Cladosporium sp. JES 115]